MMGYVPCAGKTWEAGCLDMQDRRINDGWEQRTFRVLIGIIALLLLLHVASLETGMVIFHLDGEGNIPAWYSFMLLGSIGILSISMASRIRRLSGKRRSDGLFWRGFGLFFLFLAYDELFQVHELFDMHTSVKWVYAYAPFAGIFFLATVFYMMRLRGETALRRWVLGGLMVYAAGGMGMEAVSHLLYPLPWVLQQLELVAEEGGEMLGVCMILRGCLHELSSLAGEVVSRTAPMTEPVKGLSDLREKRDCIPGNPRFLVGTVNELSPGVEILHAPGEFFPVQGLEHSRMSVDQAGPDHFGLGLLIGDAVEGEHDHECLVGVIPKR